MVRLWFALIYCWWSSFTCPHRLFKSVIFFPSISSDELDESIALSFQLMQQLSMDGSSSIATSSQNAIILPTARECTMAATSLHRKLPQKDQARSVTSYCNVCNLQFCDTCWDIQPTHMFRTLGVTGVPHEKTDPIVTKIGSSCA